MNLPALLMKYDCIYDTYDVYEEPLPVCPNCESECEWVYRNPNNEIVGCEHCLDRVDAYEINF